MRTRYVHRPDHPQADEFGFIPAHLAQPTSSGKGIMVMSDIEPFKSPIDGSIIGSRSAVREHEKAHGVRQVGNDWSGSTKPAWWDRRQEMARTRKD